MLLGPYKNAKQKRTKYLQEETGGLEEGGLEEALINVCSSNNSNLSAYMN